MSLCALSFCYKTTAPEYVSQLIRYVDLSFLEVIHLVERDIA